jgi:putative transposase
MERLTAQRREVLRAFGLDADAKLEHPILGENRPRGQCSPRIASQIAKLSPGDRARLPWQLYEAWDGALDRGAGECVLARPELSEIVAQSLHYFDDQRYVLIDYVVMRNHVHVLAAFAEEDGLLTTATSWKKFTATRINQTLGRRGEFWQFEQFDHLVRSPERFEHLRRYIEQNPKKAGLHPGEYCHFSKEL